ncbi:MAG TPA: hypothetical protein V6C81_29240 [Planktothrix sp.]|jgi:hypothetical protein
MVEIPATTSPLFEKAAQDYGLNQPAFQTDVADIVRADLGDPAKLSQDARVLEQQQSLSVDDLISLGFPWQIFGSDGTVAANHAKAVVKSAQVKLDAQHQPVEVDYPNGTVIKARRDKNEQITSAQILNSPGHQYDGTFKLQSDGLLHEYDASGKDTGITVEPGDIKISSNGAIQVVAKEKLGFFDVSGYIEIDPQGNATTHAGSPPDASQP